LKFSTPNIYDGGNYGKKNVEKLKVVEKEETEEMTF